MSLFYGQISGAGEVLWFIFRGQGVRAWGTNSGCSYRPEILSNFHTYQEKNPLQKYRNWNSELQWALLHFDFRSSMMIPIKKLYCSSLSVWLTSGAESFLRSSQSLRYPGNFPPFTKFHYQVNMSPPLDPIMCEILPVHTLISRFFLVGSPKKLYMHLSSFPCVLHAR